MDYYSKQAAQKAYLQALLGEREIARRIKALPPGDRRVAFATFTGPDMKPDQMVAWSSFASAFPDATMNGDGIYRPKVYDELVATVVENEWSKREYRSEYEWPENLDNPELAAAVTLAERAAATATS